MLFFVFLVATLNLGVGYALGAGLTLDRVLELLPARSRRTKAGDLDEDDAAPLTQPATQPAPPSATEPAESASQPEASEPAAETDAEEAPRPTPKSPQEVMQSLACFREKLASTSVELKLSQEDPERFDECASRLQQCNEDYLAEADGAVENLGELGEQGDTVAAATRDAVVTGREKVGRLSDEIDDLIEPGMDADARKALIEKAQQMRDTAERVERSTDSAIGNAESKAATAGTTPTPKPSAAAKTASAPTAVRSLDSVDEVFTELENALQSVSDESPAHLVAIRLDPIEGREDDEALFTSIERAVLRMVGETLDETQSYCAGRPTIGLLEGDTFDEAAERVERLRQRVAATTFELAGIEVEPKLTCAIADAKAGDERVTLTEQLDAALAEADRLGANRTYHHDGAFPTPVPEPLLAIEPERVKLG